MPYQPSFVDYAAFYFLYHCVKVQDSSKVKCYEGFMTIEINGQLLYFYTNIAAFGGNPKKRKATTIPSRHLLLQGYKTLVANEIDAISLIEMSHKHTNHHRDFKVVRAIELQVDPEPNAKKAFKELDQFVIQIQDEHGLCFNFEKVEATA